MIDMLNLEREAEGERGLKMGVGIATGEVVAGYAGTQERATYTCIGTTVNLAARLEAQTKETGHRILIDPRTRADLGDAFAIDAMLGLALKGFSEPVTAYAICDAKAGR